MKFKKITAAFLAMLLAGTCLVSCGDAEDDDSSKKNNSSSVSENNAEGETLAAQYSASMSKSCTVDMTIKMSTSVTGEMEMPIYMTTDGKNAYMKMSTMGIETETFIIDGAATMLLPSLKTYVKVENYSLDSQVNTGTLPTGSKLLESKTEGATTIETYQIEAAGQTQTIKYYFDTASKTPQKIDMDMGSLGKTNIVFNSIKYVADESKFTAPNLTGWTDGTELYGSSLKTNALAG